MPALAIPTSNELAPTKIPPGLGSVFITLREASFRSGVAMETLARRCREEWSPVSLAKLTAGEGNRMVWHVREDADAGFARVKSPEWIAFDWSKLSAQQADRLRRRKLILDQWLDNRTDGMATGQTERACTDLFIARCRTTGDRVGRTSLFRWYNCFRAGGYASLMDARLNARPVDADRKAFVDEMKRAFLSSRRYSAVMAYELASWTWHLAGKQPPFGVELGRKMLAKVDKKIACLHREGQRVYDAKYGKHVRRTYADMVSNETWTSDGHRLNFFIRVPGKDKPVRPVLLSWMDVRSRKIVGWKIVTSAENSDVILAAFRMGVTTHGLPQTVQHDNGEGYDATALQGVSKAGKRKGELPSIDLGLFPRLNIGVTHSIAYNAKAKIIERWHRTLDERFSKLIPTYTGGSIATKPHDLEEQKARNCPDLATVEAMFADWLAGDYHSREHDGIDMDGQTPNQVYADNLVEARPIDAKLLEMELSKRIELKVGRNGIRVNYHDYEAPELDSMMGRTVLALVDDTDLGRVGVLDREGRWLCWASAIKATAYNATTEQLRDAIAHVRRDSKRVRQAEPAKKRLRIASDPAERLAQLAELARASEPEATPKVVNPFVSKLDPARIGDAHEQVHPDTGEIMPPPAMRIAGSDEPAGILPDVNDPMFYAKMYERREAQRKAGMR
jgi:transposase InsO family protein